MTDQQSVETNSIQRTLTGVVSSNKMDKTVVVKIVNKVKDPRYGKYVKRTSKMVVHDEANACNIGDTVLIKQSRPLSKTKRWTLVEILKREEVK